LSFILVASSLHAQNRPDALVRGDSAFAALKYDRAVEEYRAALHHTDSAAVLWRLARVLICMGDVEEGEVSERLYREAERHARRAVELDSGSADTHTWYAAALGSVALHVGGRTKVQYAHKILHELNRAIELNDTNDIAYSILGSFHRAMGGLSWFERQLAAIFLGRLPEGSYEDGVRALRKAIALNPNAPRHHYELGMLYLDWGKEELAREEFARVVTLPIITARDIQNKADAERRLVELSGH
jgi:tetratricopeptide (TPR) repeat protein